MSRTELITTAKELGLTFERPATQIKSEVLEAAIAAALATTETAIAEEVIEELPVQEDEMPNEAFVNVGVTTPKAEVEVKTPKVHIYDEILAFAQSGLSRTAIYNELKTKHPKLNYRYVVQTLLKAKASGVELNIPRQERVFTPKADAIASLEAKLAKMKAAAAEVVIEPVTDVEEPVIEEVPNVEDGTVE